MFERFTDSARTVVLAAHDLAAGLHADTVGPAHLLLALTDDPGRAGQVLRDAGADADAVRAVLVRERDQGGLDADALAALGIDLERVRDNAEAAFGPGALDAGPPATHAGGRRRFNDASKQVLVHALRRVQLTRGRGIDSEAVLRGVLDVGDPTVARVFRQLGIDPDDLLARLGGRGAA